MRLGGGGSSCCGATGFGYARDGDSE